MRCWNCTTEVPTSPFCRNCGAALPDPETRRIAITSRLAEITAERTVLEAQLQRITGNRVPTDVTSTNTSVASSVTPTSSPATAPDSAEPMAVIIPRPPVTTVTRAPLFAVDLSPTTIVTLVGVVLLAAASFVSAKENPALISLSHGTRLVILIIESLVAAGVTFYLAGNRTTLADAFGALTWSATLSLGLLATVNVSNGLRHDAWTYSLPFIVGALIVALARRHLDLTRFVGVGTLAFGVTHLAYFGLNPNVDGYQYAPEVTMTRGVIVMILISMVASGGLWTAFSPRLVTITRAERYLVFLSVGLLLVFSLTAPLPRVTTSVSGLLALLGEVSIAAPFFLAAVALRWRNENPTGVVIFGVVGGWITLGFFAAALLGHIEVVTPFPGSRTLTLVFPVIFSALALGLAVAARRFRSFATIFWTLAATSLIPALGAVAATLRWELVGGLGRDGLVPVGQISTLSMGWFGHDVTIGDVAPLTIGLSGLALVCAALLASRATLRPTPQRALRHVAGLVSALSVLAVGMRYTDPANSTVITAVVLMGLGVGAFLASRFVRDDAPLDEWLPLVLLGGGLMASYSRNAAFTGYGSEFRPGGLTMASLGIVAIAGVITALRRRTTWHAFAGWSVVLPAFSGIYAIHHTPRLAWQIAIVALGSAFLVQSLVTRPRGREGFDISASTGLLLSASYAYVSQIATMSQLGYEFRIAVVLLGLSVTVALAQRRGAQLPAAVVLAPAVIAGVFWGSHLTSFDHAAWWVTATAVAVVALLWNHDEPEHASWIEWGPSLALTMIPANLGALTGSSLSAAIAIGAAVVLIIVGVQLKKRAVFDVAIATFALLSIARLTQVVSDQGRWIVAVIVGVALVGNGFWRETRKKSAANDDAPVTSWYRSLS